MEQRLRPKYVAVKDVQTKLRKVECAKGMGQRSNDMNALLTGAQILSSEEECALGMGQR